ncbi:fructose-specific PTS transporter subunit EIIC [Nostocoides vanveenii]|uniref:fructose-specific PTS transporter subunit EIIC n=1 Tax=Nostocoides vanveenii TaxID=330835 RepID=UPI0031E31845
MEDRPEPRRGGCCGWRCHERRWRRHGHQGRRERGRRNADPADADDRRVLHDSLRCRRRHHDRPGLHALELRAWQGGPGRDRQIRTDRRGQLQHRPALQSGEPDELGGTACCHRCGGLRLLVPILSGFIAYAIADRPGLVPGIVGGAIATSMGAGFLGGLATGFLGGYLALWVSRWKVHKNVRGVMPVVVIPLVSTFLTAGLFITILGRPITWLMSNLTSALEGMGGSSAILLGLILGAMMGFDLGGPVNKVAYSFGVAGLTEGLSKNLAADATQYKIMAAVMAAGMVAPLAMALATTIRPQLFSEPERENGKAAWLLGASFISEGAIPFAAADPVRIMVSSVIGSALTGGIVMALGSTLMAPHGGIWVGLLIGKLWVFLLGLIIGVLVMTGIVVFLKRRDHSAAAAAAQTVEA